MKSAKQAIGELLKEFKGGFAPSTRGLPKGVRVIRDPEDAKWLGDVGEPPPGVKEGTDSDGENILYIPGPRS